MKIDRNGSFRSSGFSLTETVIVVAMMGIIGSAVYAFFDQSQRLSLRTTQAQEMSAERFAVLFEMLADLRAAKRSSIGNLTLNGDYELSVDSTTASYWAANATGNGTMNYLSGSSIQNVHRGFHAIALSSTDGTAVTYDSGPVMTLTSSSTYLITGWIRTTGGAAASINLIDTTGSVVTSSASSSTTGWQRLAFRYPDSGSYTNGTLTNNQARIRLSVQSAAGTANFDDISTLSINAVLASTITAEVNVGSNVSDMSNPADNVGFSFVEWTGAGAVLSRYRIQDDQAGRFLIREEFDPATPLWREKTSIKLAQDGKFVLKIMRDDNSDLLTNGTDTPIRIRFGIQNGFQERQKLVLQTDSVMIFPIAQ